MTPVLLDTNIIIDTLNRKANRLRQLDELILQGASLACTSINITEIYMGMRPSQATVTAHFLSALDLYPVTPEAARLAGRMYADWRQKGQTLSVADLTIAAVCITEGLALFTENRKHFPMPELNLYMPGN